MKRLDPKLLRRITHRFTWIVTALILAGAALACSPSRHDIDRAAPLPTTASASTSTPGESIGTATMKPDGTIVLTLRAEGPGMRGDARIVYPPSHREYASILRHLGGLRPGETKPVRPWPERAQP